MTNTLSNKQGLSRRDFLRLSGLGALGALAGSALGLPSPAKAWGRTLTGLTEPDVEINLRAVIGQEQIRSGLPTTVWRYEADLVKGPAGTVQPLPNTYLGPILHFQPGQRVRIHFTNTIDEETIVHWHGLHVPEAADGHPRLVIGPNETYVYDFEIMDRPGTYWYHPHPHGRTGPQAYYGLAGLIIISDGTEAQQGLPTGAYDLPLVIQDRTFDGQNQLVYATNMAGFLGNEILVNGQPNASLTVEQTTYRFRVLNGSNSRIYKLGWPDGAPFTVIGSDGGLLDAPVQRNYVVIAPGERVELLVDFSRWPAGSVQTLRSLAFAGAGFGGGGSTTTLPNGSDYEIMRFRIEAQDTPTLTPTPTPSPTPTATSTPPTLSNPTYMPLILNGAGANGSASRTEPRLDFQADQAQPQQATRTFYLYVQFGQWTINGRTFQMEAVAPDETVELGAQEIWEFSNNFPNGGGMGGGMPHPMHIHGLQFRVVSRQAPTNATQRSNWETVKDGYVDGGWKDTVLVMPGERVQVQVEFKDYTGLYLYHCHNLEHEDMGMMRNYRVVQPNRA
ncbi:MAG TPA: twin-arginine translocation signal domain-containing protein [Anaerolineae bacterium]|nr:multicopper oxidase domain-containing protein [Caldilineae bacterium]HID34229.1 twin-arginine translocation signal domain-containing protein [Anaerolineae bacterium]